MDLKIPEIMKSMFNTDKRYIILYGGRGSSKSHTVARYLILKALEENCIIMCTREYQVSVKDSVHGLIAETIKNLGLENYFEIQHREIRCITGSKFLFSGLQNIGNLKSKESIKYLWIEEADNLNKTTFEVVDPTIRVEDSQIIMVFNPQSEEDYPLTEFVNKKREDTLVIKANYYDNPFITKPLLQQMKYAKENNVELYNHVWLGNPRSISDALVFKNKFVIDAFETPEDVIFYYGSDFGYSKDPSTLIRSFIIGNTLYIDNECYANRVEINDLPSFYSPIYDIDVGWMIVGDSARPDTISYLQNRGINIKGSKKGKGSVEDGVSHLKSFDKIVIHPRCKETIREFKNYSYKVDPRTGKVTPILVDNYNHLIDALRYSLEDIRKGRGELKPLFVQDSTDDWDNLYFPE